MGWCIPSFHPYSLWNCSSFPGVAQKHTIIHLCGSGVWEENEPCWCQHPIKQHILQALHCTFTSLPSWAFRREWTQNKCHQSSTKCSKRLNINSLLLMLWFRLTLGIYMYILLPFFFLLSLKMGSQGYFPYACFQLSSLLFCFIFAEKLIGEGLFYAFWKPAHITRCLVISDAILVE